MNYLKVLSILVGVVPYLNKIMADGKVTVNEGIGLISVICEALEIPVDEGLLSLKNG